MSSSEIAGLLGVSGGSVSTATRELINPGVVARVRVPGERQDYFRCTLGAGALPQFIRIEFLEIEQASILERWEQLQNERRSG
jgi:DNA-binding transcriptional regulator GbsR (MarR family)